METPKKPFVAGQIQSAPIKTNVADVDDLAAPFAIHCPLELMNRMMAHAKRFQHTEVFGLLLGDVVKTSSGKMRTVISDYIAAERFHRSTVTFVEVTPDELIRMDRQFEARAAVGAVLKVGWFHTHPGHGIFMSSTDRENHAMYNKPWQVALVLDPIRDQVGFFHSAECVPAVWIQDTAIKVQGSLRQEEDDPPKKPRFIIYAAVFGLFLSGIAGLVFGYRAYRRSSFAMRKANEASDRVKEIQKERKVSPESPVSRPERE